ncbi:glycoside hydrolase family 18 protein [Brevibacillus daliensis]|uniref:glycoside hydrolase family 18 protein n=1 Tax=Brevibacillus daliensis TaxID=2892995 RepID=UPI001E4E714D|nr:glycoside hydrolase family 18 protein [Brevibacillus daliensis]
MKRFLSLATTLFLVLALVIPATSFAKGTNPPSPTNSTEAKKKHKTPYSKRIIAYYPEWAIYDDHNNYTPAQIPWDKITHLNYAFADINMKTGTIEIFDKYASTLAPIDGAKEGSKDAGALGSIRKLKKKHPHVKALISVGGWSRSAGFHDVAATQEAREKFAKSAVEFIRHWNFDGVDIDWEYPGQVRQPDPVDSPDDLGTPKADASERETYTLLLKDLRKALDKAGKEDGKYYELTVAVGAGINMIERTDPDKYHQYLDFINIMTYDYHGAWENVTGHQSALLENPKEPYDQLSKTHFNTAQTLKNFEKYGVPKDKLIVGTPFYSRGWGKVKGDGPIPGLPGLFSSATPGSVRGIWDGGRNAGNNPYYHLKNVIAKEPSFKQYYDPVSKATYLYSVARQEMFSFEGPQSLQDKVDYVKKNNYGGIIVWDLSGDHENELISIIAKGFKKKDKDDD